MNPTVKQHCIKIMDQLISREIAGLFVEPVDPVLDGCPDYFDVILHPMDLTTCKTNLEQDKYQNLNQWKQDVDLIWNNAIIFNGSDSIIGIIAAELQDVFNEYTKFFTDSPANDWVTKLNQICDDFNQAVKVLSIANPNVTRKSPSFLGFPQGQSDAEDMQMTREEIAQLGEEISSLEDPISIKRMFERLKSLEPQIIGDKKGITINICDLPSATLYALKEELESIKRESK